MTDLSSLPDHSLINILDFLKKKSFVYRKEIYGIVGMKYLLLNLNSIFMNKLFLVFIPAIVLILCSNQLKNETASGALKLNQFVDSGEYPFNLLNQEELAKFSKALVVENGEIISGSLEAVATTLSESQIKDLFKTLYSENGILAEESSKNPTNIQGFDWVYWVNHVKVGKSCWHKRNSWCRVNIIPPQY